MGQIETILTPYKLTPLSPDYIQPASFTSRLLRPTAIPVLDLLAKLHGVGQPLVWRVVEVGVMGIGLRTLASRSGGVSGISPVLRAFPRAQAAVVLTAVTEKVVVK